MDRIPDTNRALRQRIEMDDFFTGFSIAAEHESETTHREENNLSGKCAENLEDIAVQIRKCSKCGLSSERNNAVPGEGADSADIVFVGEAPGADEDRQGRPFVGRAGKLLDKILTACGLRREDIFICNILKCRPPGNRDPKPDEVISCHPYLDSQLKIIRPKEIIALGAHAARTLLDSKEAIGRLRGRFHDYYLDEQLPPVKLMPTYHPAYLLRNYSVDNRRKVWEDMQKVMKEVGLAVPGKGS